MERNILMDFLNLLVIIKEDILIPNGIKYIDNRKWIGLFYGNRFGYLPYETDEDLQRILKEHQEMFNYEIDNGRIIKKEVIKKKGFELQL